MGFSPSKFQAAIFDFIATGQGSAIIEAVAGSGKTTTIVEALKLIPPQKRVLFLAFNKSIAMELAKRVPAHTNAMTMNSLGHRAVMAAFGRVELDSDKTRKILNEELAEEIGDADLKRLGFAIRKLVGLAKATGIVPESRAKDLSGILPDTAETWNNLIDHFDIQINDDEPETDEEDSAERSDRVLAVYWARRVLEISVERTTIIDFDDQLYFPVIYNLPLPVFDWVFVDEAQDVSDIQRALICKAVRPHTGRLVAVGDPCQAIYGFRGADSDSLNNIAKTFNAVRLPLSISYRCGKTIIREAQRFVGHIEAAETAHDGEVQKMGPYNTAMFQINDMVVCRATAPLVKLAFKLIADRKPVKLMGREIGQGLISLINKLKPRSIPHLREKLDRWKEKEIERLQKKDPEANLDVVYDKYDVLNTFIEMSGANSVDQVKQSIESLFGEKAAGVTTLATIHKSKGLEADRVFILDSWMMPSKYAKKEWQQRQETNLQYVAVTRAKKFLGYIETKKRGE